MRRLSSLSSTTSIFFSIALPLLRAPAPPGQYAARDADSQPEVASRSDEFDMPDAIRLAPRDAGPDALRAEPHRRAPHRERAHRALQLPLRAPPRRRVRAAHRGHGPRALDRGVDARHPRGPRLARPRLGRGPLPPERAPGPLPRARRGPPRRRSRLSLLVHARGARGAPAGSARRGPASRLRPHLP